LSFRKFGFAGLKLKRWRERRTSLGPRFQGSQLISSKGAEDEITTSVLSEKHFAKINAPIYCDFC
jgi:hypothetical protein